MEDYDDFDKNLLKSTELTSPNDKPSNQTDVRTVTAFQLMMITYFSTCGGPFGIERCTFIHPTKKKQIHLFFSTQCCGCRRPFVDSHHYRWNKYILELTTSFNVCRTFFDDGGKWRKRSMGTKGIWRFSGMGNYRTRLGFEVMRLIIR